MISSVLFFSFSLIRLLTFVFVESKQKIHLIKRLMNMLNDFLIIISLWRRISCSWYVYGKFRLTVPMINHQLTNDGPNMTLNGRTDGRANGSSGLANNSRHMEGMYATMILYRGIEPFEINITREGYIRLTVQDANSSTIAIHVFWSKSYISHE